MPIVLLYIWINVVLETIFVSELITCLESSNTRSLGATSNVYGKHMLPTILTSASMEKMIIIENPAFDTPSMMNEDTAKVTLATKFITLNPITLT